MGSGFFAKLFRFACLAAIAAVAAFLAAVYTANPASADPGGGNGNVAALKNWDSDNLRFPGYTFASFRIPSHSYGTATTPRYSHAACGHGGVADGYYQTKSGPSGVNDFPVREYKNGTFAEKTSSSLPCDEFVQAQERMVIEAAANGAHWLDSQGIVL